MRRADKAIRTTREVLHGVKDNQTYFAIGPGKRLAVEARADGPPESCQDFDAKQRRQTLQTEDSQTVLEDCALQIIDQRGRALSPQLATSSGQTAFATD